MIRLITFLRAFEKNLKNILILRNNKYLFNKKNEFILTYFSVVLARSMLLIKFLNNVIIIQTFYLKKLSVVDFFLISLSYYFKKIYTKILFNYVIKFKEYQFTENWVIYKNFLNSARYSDLNNQKLLFNKLHTHLYSLLPKEKWKLFTAILRVNIIMMIPYDISITPTIAKYRISEAYTFLYKIFLRVWKIAVKRGGSSYIYFFSLVINIVIALSLNISMYKKVIQLLASYHKPTSYINLSKIFKIPHYSSLLVIYNGIKTFTLPLFVASFLFFTIIDYFNVNFIRQFAVWIVIILLFFWLISGFNFFLKRYKNGKFTSAIQRFWKRTNSYFWIVEGFLFSLFFYYYLNSSQEVAYFFDESSLNQTHLTNMSSFFFSSLILLFIILYTVYLLLNASNFTFYQELVHLTIVSSVVIYVFILESYQFYYVIAAFAEIKWDFNVDSNVWELATISPWVRVKNQYFSVALIAKYWHFLFIFISWLFMILKFFETKKLNYTLLGVNLQNYMLLYFLNILFNANWLKFITRRFYDDSYFWFFTNWNSWSIFDLFQEFIHTGVSLVSILNACFYTFFYRFVLFYKTVS